MTRPPWLRGPYRYRGHLVWSPPGVHESAVALLREVVPLDATILDIASGSGAMGAYLRDAGYTDIRFLARTERLVGVTPETTPRDPGAVELPLDRPFAEAAGGPYSAIISCEVIEHLPSPRQFLGEVSRLLEPGGWLALSTPNVGHWLGRIRFLLRGDLRWFDAASARELRHLSPIARSQMELALEELGFEIVRSVSVGSLLRPWAQIVTAPLSLSFRVLLGRDTVGDCAIFLARRVR